MAAVLGLLAGALLTPLLDDEGEQAAAVDDRTALVDGRAVSCPDGLGDPVEADFDSLPGEVFLRAVLVAQDQDLADLYCLQVQDFDPIRPVPVRVGFSAAEDTANYGETYSAQEPGGSEELLNFPFLVGTYGACRTVTATIEQRDGTTHSARVRLGPRCGERG